jgi:hypothetical protein
VLAVKEEAGTKGAHYVKKVNMANFILSKKNRVARCRYGQLYGGGEKLKVLLALSPLRSTLTFSPPPSPCF